MTPAAAGIWVAEALEPRRLHAADALPGVGPVATLLSEDAAAPSVSSLSSAELVVVDAGVAGSDTLLAALRGQQAAGRALEILAIAPGDDGLAELGRALGARADSGLGGYSAVHVLSHGSDGRLQLGASVLDASVLLQRAGEVAAWSAALTPDADLLLYGCDLAEGDAGRALLRDLALLTGADVAASTDATGTAALGGDWVLEAATGTIDVATVVDAASASAWRGTLAEPFRINQTVPNLQATSAATRGSTQAVAADASGHFVVVWSSRSDVDGYQVLLRRFESDGTPLADEAVVNATTSAGDQQHASVAMAADGRFVVAWASSGGSTPAGIYVRRYGAAGNALGAEQRIDVGGANADNPTLAINRATGDFVVTWQGPAGGDSAGIAMRRFAADGTALDATARLVNSSDRGTEAAPTVAMDTSGRFVIAWDVGGQVLFQRFAADGSAQGGATVVDAALSAGSGAAVAVDGSGRFTIAWRDDSVLGLGLLGSGVWLRGFEADGSARTASLQVADGDATNASLATHADGSLSVVYDRSGANGRDVLRQRLAGDGTVLEAATVLNTERANDQVMPSAAALPRGSLVAVWSGYSDPGLGGDAQGVAAVFVGAVNRVPTLTSDGGGDSASLALAENLSAVTTVRATDADGDTLTFSLAGADAARFTLDAATGALAFASAPDFEAPADADGDNVYDVIVAVNDGLASDSQALQVRVTDVGGPLVVSTTADTADGATASVEALLANPGADGAISLREALIAANATTGADRIEFAIGGAGVRTITLASALPQITDAVVIDGRTQPGSGSTPRVVLDGVAAGADQTGLVFTTGSDGSELRGLALLRFSRTGVLVNGGAGDITVAGNHIGVAADGLTRQANTVWGIDVINAGRGVVIGGATAADGNVIGVGGGGGVVINGTLDATVQGNFIGVARDGTTALGGNVGVWALNATLGTRVLDNTIAFNQEGVVVQGFSARAAITGNLIYGHSDLGIDIGADRAVLANDSQDADVGANLGQNFPVITQAETDGTQLVVSGTLESVNDTNLLIEVFASAAANASGYGEGQRLLGSVQVRTDSNGLASFSLTLGALANPGEVVSATASRLTSGGVAYITSEFSRARTVTVNQAPVFNTPAADGSTLTVAEGSTAVTTVRATDPEGTAVRYSLAGADAARFTIGTTSGVLSFAQAPDHEAPGSAGGQPAYQLTLLATDARGLVSSRALTVALQDLDDNRPVVSAGQAFDVAEDSAAGTGVGTLVATDADAVGGPLTWALLGGNNGNAFTLDAASGELRVANPAALDVRNGRLFTLTVAARDSVGASAATIVTVRLTAVNHAPEVGTALSALTAWEDEAFSATLPDSAFTDRDGDTLTWALRQADGSALPDWLRFDAASRTLAGTPGTADIGTLSLTVTASDAGGASASQALTITAANTNDAPSGRDATLTLAEDGTRVFTLADFGFSDSADTPANTFASLQLVSLSGAGHWTLDGQAVSAGQTVTAADLAAGRFAFRPVADANGSAYAQLGFRVRDDGGTAHGGSDTDATVRVLTLNVTAVNDAPDLGTALPPLAVWEDEAFTATLSDSAFTDCDGDTLTWALRQADGSALPAWLRFDAASRALAGTPGTADIGTLSLTVTASDAGGASASQALTITVANTNDAPSGRDATLTLAEDGTRVFTLADFGFSDSADTPANTFASLQLVSLSGAGRWTLDSQAVSAGQTVTAADLAAGRFAFRPVADANGSAYAQLGFRVRDDGGTAHGGSDTDATMRLLTLDVTPLNDAPDVNAALPLLTAWEDEAFSVTLPASAFSDRDGDTLAWALRQADGSALPAWLRFDAASRTLAGTPAAADIGTLALVATASDASGTRASQAFTITVTNTNDAPSGRDATLTLAEDGTRVITLADFGFSDSADTPANALASLQIVSLTGAGRWTLDGQAVTAGQAFTAADLAAGRFAFRPVADANGSAYAQLGFRLRDDGGTAHGGSDTDATVRHLTVNVTPVDDAPQLLGNALQLDATTLATPVLLVADVDTAPAQLLLSASEVRGGRFERLGSDGATAPTPVSQFTLADVLEGRVRFQRDSTSTLPDYRLAVRDASSPDGAPVPVTLLLGTQPAAPAPAEITPAPLPAPSPEPVAASGGAAAPAAAAANPGLTDTAALPAPTAEARGDVAALPELLATPVLLDSPSLQRAPAAASPPDGASTASAMRSEAPAATAEAWAAPLAELPALVDPLSPLVAGSQQPEADRRALNEGLAQLRERLAQVDEGRIEALTSGTTVGAGLSVGYVVWLLRGGVLMSSMLAALPAWQLLDPLMLTRIGTGRRDERDDSDEVETLFSRSRRLARARARSRTDAAPAEEGA